MEPQLDKTSRNPSNAEVPAIWKYPVTEALLLILVGHVLREGGTWKDAMVPLDCRRYPAVAVAVV